MKMRDNDRSNPGDSAQMSVNLCSKLSESLLGGESGVYKDPTVVRLQRVNMNLAKGHRHGDRELKDSIVHLVHGLSSPPR